MKQIRTDNLGHRLKQYEALTTSTKLMPNLPVYARIDGRAFHTFCTGLEKPYCMELVETMQQVCKFLVEETHALLGYVQSDEISLCWENPAQAPFDGKLFKLESILASLATSKFVNYCVHSHINFCYAAYEELKEQEINKKYNSYLKLFNKCRKLNPSFDCRVFQVPNISELANCFIWREIDAVRNSVQMLAQANFSHKSLQGIDSKGLQNKLLTEKDINWNDLRDDLKRGAYFKRVLIEKEMDEETWNKIPDDKKPESRMVIRSEIQRYELPIMKNVVNKVEVYFDDAKPIFKEDL